MSKTAQHKKRKHKSAAAASPPASDRAVYIVFVMIGAFVVLLSFPLFQGQWRWPALAYVTLVALLVNLQAFRAYRGQARLAAWQKALARLPMRCVGYGSRGGKPLEAAHGQPEARTMLIATAAISILLIGGAAWLLLAV